MLTNFDAAMRFVLKHEGGLSEDPRDTGGITKHGISIKFAGSIHFDLDGDGKTTAADIRALDTGHAKAIYREHFWDRLYCDLLPGGIDLLVVDGAINQGVNRMARLLQRSLGLVDDGVLGPKSRAAIGALLRAPERHHGVLRELAYRRAKKYSEAATVEHHGNGWFRRLFEAYDESLTLKG